MKKGAGMNIQAKEEHLYKGPEESGSMASLGN